MPLTWTRAASDKRSPPHESRPVPTPIHPLRLAIVQVPDARDRCLLGQRRSRCPRGRCSPSCRDTVVVAARHKRGGGDVRTYRQAPKPPCLPRPRPYRTRLRGRRWQAGVRWISVAAAEEGQVVGHGQILAPSAPTRHPMPLSCVKWLPARLYQESSRTLDRFPPTPPRTYRVRVTSPQVSVLVVEDDPGIATQLVRDQSRDLVRHRPPGCS
jgi:hypothetical protein